MLLQNKNLTRAIELMMSSKKYLNNNIQDRQPQIKGEFNDILSSEIINNFFGEMIKLLYTQGSEKALII